VFRTVDEAKKGLLERALSPFADVRAGEGIGVLLLTVNVFLLLALYYLLRSARQALILTEGAPFGWTGASSPRTQPPAWRWRCWLSFRRSGGWRRGYRASAC
jgi:hypothetical protein